MVCLIASKTFGFGHKIFKYFSWWSKLFVKDKFLCKIFKNYRICTQNIWKVCNLGPNHSKSVEFLRKTIERICNCTPITRNACVSHFVSKHLKIMSFCLKIFEIYLILDQNIRDLLYFYTTQFEKFRICTQKLQKVFVLENLQKVFDFNPKH